MFLNVGFGSKADTATSTADVRSTPASGHRLQSAAMPVGPIVNTISQPAPAASASQSRRHWRRERCRVLATNGSRRRARFRYAALQTGITRRQASLPRLACRRPMRWRRLTRRLQTLIQPQGQAAGRAAAFQERVERRRDQHVAAFGQRLGKPLARAGHDHHVAEAHRVGGRTARRRPARARSAATAPPATR